MMAWHRARKVSFSGRRSNAPRAFGRLLSSVQFVDESGVIVSIILFELCWIWSVFLGCENRNQKNKTN